MTAEKIFQTESYYALSYLCHRIHIGAVTSLSHS